MMRYICCDCQLDFHEPDRVAEYVDDSNRPAYYMPVCPFCRSEDIIEEFIDEEEEE